MRARVRERLDRLAAGFAAMRADGYPVEVIAPQGAIYLSVRFAIPRHTNEATRQLLLTTGRVRGGPVPGVRPARGQRLVPHLGGRGVAGGDRRRLPAPAGRAAATLSVDVPRAAAAPAALALAFVLRWRLFPFAENKHGDAPMRALIAERMVLEPARAAVPRTYCQFGPLHTTLMRPFIALDPVASRSSRYLSLLAGIGVLFPFLAFARRLWVSRASRAPRSRRSRWRCRRCTSRRRRPPPARRCTCCSGSARSSGCWPRSRRPAGCAPSRVAGLLASLAAVTRYDAWLALPIVALAALLFVRGDRRALLRGLAVFSLCAASLPRPGWCGARAPAAIRSSSRTTS